MSHESSVTCDKFPSVRDKYVITLTNIEAKHDYENCHIELHLICISTLYVFPCHMYFPSYITMELI